MSDSGTNMPSLLLGYMTTCAIPRHTPLQTHVLQRKPFVREQRQAASSVPPAQSLKVHAAVLVAGAQQRRKSSPCGATVKARRQCTRGSEQSSGCGPAAHARVVKCVLLGHGAQRGAGHQARHDGLAQAHYQLGVHLGGMTLLLNACPLVLI